ncbi:hypothetical protein BX666DRAFT_360052 [Dichotomocladium elegans]|nr:hypothetical protein BX666DRAFT_360052 [Dichotomocladium elegans]
MDYFYKTSTLFSGVDNNSYAKNTEETRGDSRRQVDMEQSSFTEDMGAHEGEAQRAVVGESYVVEPIEEHDFPKPSLDQRSDIDPSVAASRYGRADMATAARQKPALPSPAKMPSLPPAGVFDVDAAGNAPVITGYDHDPRSYTARVAKNIADTHDFKNTPTMPKDVNSYLRTHNAKFDRHQEDQSSSVYEKTAAAANAVGAAAGAGAASATGLVSRCIDYLRGSISEDDSAKQEHPTSSREDSDGLDTVDEHEGIDVRSDWPIPTSVCPTGSPLHRPSKAIARKNRDDRGTNYGGQHEGWPDEKIPDNVYGHALYDNISSTYNANKSVREQAQGPQKATVSTTTSSADQQQAATKSVWDSPYEEQTMDESSTQRASLMVRLQSQQLVQVSWEL